MRPDGAYAICGIGAQLFQHRPDAADQCLVRRVFQEHESRPASRVEVRVPFGDAAAVVGFEQALLLEERIDLQPFGDGQEPMV